MKQISVGILAHVDAGKTTLSEAMLYESGAVRTFGRVDHKNTTLDHDEIERQRGITVFSKQAVLNAFSTRVTLIDTPGHTDFSAEAERAMQILDYAILVISASEGVQAHTETLWTMLRTYRIPTFIFITKTDLPNPGRMHILRQLCETLTPGCIDAMDSEQFAEDAATLDEALLEEYLSTGTLSDKSISELIQSNRLVPCFWGAALKLEGITELLTALDRYTEMPLCASEQSGKVYKIMYDNAGSRLTFLKVTGGEYKVRDEIRYLDKTGKEHLEKITAMRLYSGEKFAVCQVAPPGTVCAVTGLSETYAGMALGTESEVTEPLLEPCLSYALKLYDGEDPFVVYQKIRILENEDPTFHIKWNSLLREIEFHLMGSIQIEVLKVILQRRFSLHADFGPGKILYKETISAPVEGIGHFEPLRHYAEVHLLIKPLSSGDGIKARSDCPLNDLSLNWQRLILTHILEKEHLGVLTGSPLTDVEICLVSGRAHLKHTEGGDFRQATYRAIRQGLMQAKSVLLEPYYTFRLEVPTEHVGRAIQDLHQMNGTFDPQEVLSNGYSLLRGTAPVSCMHSYASDVASYTRGRGRLSAIVTHYAPCHNPGEVIRSTGYEPEQDLENTPDSVFCAHGAGFPVKWNEVSSYMHLPSVFSDKKETSGIPLMQRSQSIDEKELERILEREFGPISRRVYGKPQSASDQKKTFGTAEPKRKVLIIDGYNLIFSWPELKQLADVDLDGAREKLMDILSSYAGFTGIELVLVFDAYKVKNGRGEKFQYKNLSVVFTKELETGDMYIERLCRSIGKNESVKVVTSDALIQISALGAGVLRVSAREFQSDIAAVFQNMNKKAVINSSGQFA